MLQFSIAFNLVFCEKKFHIVIIHDKINIVCIVLCLFFAFFLSENKYDILSGNKYDG